VGLTTHLLLVLRLMSGTVSPYLTLYAAMAWTRKTIFINLY